MHEFVEWLRQVAKDRYGSANNIRLDYVLNFLDSLEGDINTFITLPDFKAPVIEIKLDKLRKRN